MNIRLIWLVIIISLNVICGIKKELQKSKKFCLGTIKLNVEPADLLTLVLVITLVIIAINTINIPDIDAYKIFYSGRNNTIEIGYVFLEKIFNKAGCDFYFFRGVIIVASFILLWIGLEKLQINGNIAFALFAIFPYEYDIIQLRNFFALAIVIFSLQFIFFYVSKKRILIYIVLILIATSIHSLSIIYLILIFSNQFITEKKWIRQLLTLIFCLILVISIAFKNNVLIQNILTKLFYSFNSDKASAYITGNIGWGFLSFWIMHGVFLLCAYILKKGRYNFETDKKQMVVEQLFWTDLIIACTFPLCIMNVNFFRIYRNLFILNYGQLGMLCKMPHGKRKWIGIIIFVAGYIYILQYNLNIEPEKIIYPFWGILN